MPSLLLYILKQVFKWTFFMQAQQDMGENV